jgi:small-conductance mechanosensitive channel
VLDGGLLVVLYFFISDIFQVTIGKGLQSIAAVGGLSTIIFGLAAKDFAQMLIAGIAIYNSDKFYEGEKVRFGDGTTGKIDHQGYFELHIRGTSVDEYF